MNLGFNSLAFRIVAYSTIWAIVALAAIATVISTLYREASERGFESLLSAHLFNMISAVRVSEAGFLQGQPELGDLSFLRPQSGWYWSVEPVSGEIRNSLSSPSMVSPIASPPPAEVPFDSQFQRRYQTDGIAGERIDVIESEIVLDDANRIARFRIMGNRTEIEAQISAFARQVYLYLAVFGLGVIAINAAAILLGLKPLDKVRQALVQLREGTARRLDGRFPSEIQPLANETNALIENNRRIVERARTQVGNLAHSLKTPLAVLLNEGRSIGGKSGTLIEEQSATMRTQLDYYLQRARIAAQRDSVVFRTPVAPSVERLARVMRKMRDDVDVSIAGVADNLFFAGEKEDLEEILGNLLENAVKWAAGRIVVRAAIERSDRLPLRITIEDDGPGIPADKAAEALRRGARLDETNPGTGLGLAIVADLVREYEGTISLDRSALGGLKVEICLKSAE